MADVIIIGAGLNGLVAANYLAKAGKRVLVLERRAIVGGQAATESFGNFTADMRKQADQIVVTSRFRFTRDDGLETTLSDTARK